MKPITTLTVFAALLLTSLGCSDHGSSANRGGGSSSSNARDSASDRGPGKSAGEKLSIGVSVPAADHGWTAGIGWWAHRAMDQHQSIDWHYVEADKPEKQISDIKALMAQQSLDGLVVLATESAPLTAVAEEAHKNGIFLVSVDRGFTKPVADLFIAGDNQAFGRKSAQFMVDKLEGQAKIVVLTGIPSTVDTARVSAGMKVFDKAKAIEVLGKQPGNWNKQDAYEKMKGFLVRFDHIDAVWAQDDDMAQGAEQAIREAGRQEEMWLFGGAGKNDIVKRVMGNDPMYPADMTYPPAMIAAGVHLAVANLKDTKSGEAAKWVPKHLHLSGDQIDTALSAEVDQDQKRVKLDVHLITPDNAEEYYFPKSVY